MATSRAKNTNSVILDQKPTRIISVEGKTTGNFFTSIQNYNVIDDVVIADKTYVELKVDYVSEAEQIIIDARSSREDFNVDINQFFPPTLIRDFKLEAKAAQEKFAAGEVTNLSELGKELSGMQSLMESIDEKSSKDFEPIFAKIADEIEGQSLKLTPADQVNLEKITGGSVAGGNKKVVIDKAVPKSLNRILTSTFDKVLTQTQRQAAIEKASVTPKAASIETVEEAQAKKAGQQLASNVLKQLRKVEEPAGAFSGGPFGNILSAIQAKVQDVTPTKDLKLPQVNAYPKDFIIGDNVIPLGDLVKADGSSNINFNVRPNPGISSTIKPTNKAYKLKGDVASFTGSTTSEDFIFENIDTYEELKTDLSNAQRPISCLSVHWSKTHIDEYLTARDIHNRHTHIQRKKLGFAGALLLGTLGGIQWHYVIQRNGDLQRGRPVDLELNSFSRFHKHTVHIGFVAGYDFMKGNSLEDDQPVSVDSITAEQWESFDLFLECFFNQFPAAEAVGHRDYVANATCPGFDVLEYVEKTLGRTTALTNKDLQQYNPPSPTEIINYTPKKVAKPVKDVVAKIITNVEELSEINADIDPVTGDKAVKDTSALLADAEEWKDLTQEAEAVSSRLEGKLLAAVKTGDLTDPSRLKEITESVGLEKELGGIASKIGGLRKDLVNGGFKFDEITKGWSKEI